MTISLRVVLIVSAVAVLGFVIRKIRKSQMQALDAVFWLFFSFSFVVLAVFPDIASLVARILGFHAASNFVFLYVIAILVLRDFTMTVKYAQLRDKFDQLVQDLALKEALYRDR